MLLRLSVFDLKRVMQETSKLARENLIERKNVNKEYYDKSMKPIHIHVGNKVLITERNKKNALCKNWTGPYKVTHVRVHENITIKKVERIIESIKITLKYITTHESNNI